MAGMLCWYLIRSSVDVGSIDVKIGGLSRYMSDSNQVMIPEGLQIRESQRRTVRTVYTALRE